MEPASWTWVVSAALLISAIGFYIVLRRLSAIIQRTKSFARAEIQFLDTLVKSMNEEVYRSVVAKRPRTI
jgi:hypothetical protein